MDEILAKAQELKVALNDTKEFKEFLRLKKLYDENEEIKSLRTQMKIYKDNKVVLAKINKEYESHPLVNNYLHAKKEVEAILGVVKDIIEK